MLSALDFRRDGLPVYSLNRYEKLQQLRLLLEYKRHDLIKDGVVRQTMHGQALCWHYHPHAWKVECGGRRTPAEVFDNHVLLTSALRRRIRMGNAQTLSDRRKALRIFSGTQTVSNFRATAAAALFDRYLPDEGGTVWDMSLGFGGRLLGALASGRVSKYVGTDPATLTMCGLLAMHDELLPLMIELGYEAPEVELHRIGSEDFQPEPGSVDLCFTSPPYFDREKYSDESTQSYIKFPSPDEWLYGYLRATLRNCWTGLVPGGHLVINIANIKTFPDLTNRFQQLALEEGWTPVEALRLALSKMPGTGKQTASFKYEPVFVYRKG